MFIVCALLSAVACVAFGVYTLILFAAHFAELRND